MSAHSKIEWTDATWNPIRGVKGRWSCTKVSPGCANCYAERQNVRFGGPLYVAGADQLRLDLDVLMAPLRWRKPRRVFVCSMTDLFEKRVPDEWINSILAVIGLAPRHTFQILTKRAMRLRDLCSSAETLGRHVAMLSKVANRTAGVTLSVKHEPDGLSGMLIPNLWLGVSCEDQERADERIPLLLQTPAAGRFVSAEPLLGAMDLAGYLCSELHDPAIDCRQHGIEGGLDWVIVGGESGPKARPMDLYWVRSIRDQCRAAGVACFVKQLGAKPRGECSHAHHRQGDVPIWLDEDGVLPNVSGKEANDLCHSYGDMWWPCAPGLSNRKGADPSEWPDDLRVREFPR